MSRSIRSRLIKDAAYFYRQGWMLGTAGNLSARLRGEKEFWITASGCSKGELGLTDFVKVNFRHEAVEKFRADAKPSAETSIHSAIYAALPEALACYHVHSPESNIASLLAVKDELRLPDIEMLKGLGFYGKGAAVRVFPNHDKVLDIAAEIGRYLKAPKAHIPAVLIEGHGVTVWGKSQKEARNYVELMEYLFRYMVLAKTFVNSA